MKIRSFRPSDEKALITLWNECDLTVPWNDPAKDIQRKRDEHPDLLFVGIEGQTLIASCMAGYDGHRGWIYYLAVKPAYRHQQLAGQIVRHAEKCLIELGCPKINLMVRKTNTSVIGFYQSIGYSDDPVVVLSRRLIKDDSTTDQD